MIRLRSYKDSDERKILSWCRDEETFFSWTAGVLGEYPLTSEKFKKTGEHIRFTALDGNEPVGFFIARDPNGAQEELRFGFAIVAPEKRGRGIGKEMLKLGLKFAFDEYRAKRVTLAVFEENEKARSCYLAAGFRETGARESYFIRGKEHTALEMSAESLINDSLD
ncbi:MAG: GNAT family N-acetyltransferase [Clostridia bacterium]|nr:GNAT family N-acetyltransferase [Clostridia bacterium]